jgi:hypothetical protein
MSTTFEGSVTRHGTPSGFRRHQVVGEIPCDSCKRAKREYDQRRLSAPEKARKNRLKARAQARAENDMRRLYPDVWAVLYANHVKELTREETQ